MKKQINYKSSSPFEIGCTEYDLENEKDRKELEAKGINTALLEGKKIMIPRLVVKPLIPNIG